MILERGKSIINPYSLDEKNVVILNDVSEDEGIDILQAAMTATPKEENRSFLKQPLKRAQASIRHGQVALIFGEEDEWLVVLTRSSANEKKDYEVLCISKTKPYKAVSIGIMRIHETVNHIAHPSGIDGM